MEKQDKPLGMVIGKMMKEVFSVLKKRVGEQNEVKLTISQFHFLRAISMENDEVIQKDMAEIMGKDKSAILRMIDCLEKKELVRRVVDLNDRRKNRLMVSKKGERALEQFKMVEVDLTNELMEGIDASEIEAFHRVIEHIRNKAKSL
jgi:MarR family transcriptional regulator, transcriptional regulator for hemolysin